MAQTRASYDRKIIISMGAGRMQEWRQMLTNGFSYVVIDPDIDVSAVMTAPRTYPIMPYSFSASFTTQVITATKRTPTILWAKCRSEDFLMRAMPIMMMSSMSIPVVFSFSISYHIKKKEPLEDCWWPHEEQWGLHLERHFGGVRPDGGIGRASC